MDPIYLGRETHPKQHKPQTLRDIPVCRHFTSYCIVLLKCKEFIEADPQNGMNNEFAIAKS